MCPQWVVCIDKIKMIQSTNVKKNCEVTAPSRWQSFFPKKESFEVCKFHGATYVRPGHPSLRTQALCFNFAPRTRRKQQPLPPMARVLNTKIAPLVLQYVNSGIRLHTPAWLSELSSFLRCTGLHPWFSFVSVLFVNSSPLVPWSHPVGCCCRLWEAISAVTVGAKSGWWRSSSGILLIRQWDHDTQVQESPVSHK